MRGDTPGENLWDLGGVFMMGCARTGELGGPGFEGTPRDPRRDSCPRRTLGDLGIDREEMGDAVMELRLQAEWWERSGDSSSTSDPADFR